MLTLLRYDRKVKYFSDLYVSFSIIMRETAISNSFWLSVSRQGHQSRIRVLVHDQFCVCNRNAFLFRQPALSFVDNIFILPFSGSVWLTSVGLIAIIGFLLHGALKWENMKTHVTWSDTALLAVGAVCQQGKEFCPDRKLM